MPRSARQREGGLGNGGRSFIRVAAAADGGARVCIVAACPRAVPLRSVHWAAVPHQGGTWQPPPAGWSTAPPVSTDAGGGAWDTEMEHVAGDVYAVVLSLPAGTPGVAFVVRSHAGDWLKDGDGDFFCPLRPGGGMPSAPAQAARHAAQASTPPQQPQARAAPPPPPPPQQQQSAPQANAAPRVARGAWSDDDIRTEAGGLGTAGATGAYADWIMDAIASGEDSAQKSLMHRFNAAHELLKRCEAEGEGAVVVLYTWLRFMATRQLVWNKNYNVKPREISAAQNGLTATLCRLHRDRPDLRDVIRLTMCTVGRGAARLLDASGGLAALLMRRACVRRWHGRYGAAHPRRDPGHPAPQPLHGRLHGGASWLRACVHKCFGSHACVLCVCLRRSGTRSCTTTPRRTT